MITVNGHKLEPTIFPDKTSQVWNLPERLINQRSFKVVWEFESEGEFMHLAQLKMLLDSHHILKHGSAATIDLHIPYLPYARQDKAIKNDQCFAVNTLDYLLGKLEFSMVSAMDPHSMSLSTMNFRPLWPTEQIIWTKQAVGAEWLCFPDRGARERYGKALGWPTALVAEKRRDQATGEILGIEYSEKEIPLLLEHHGDTCLIVDDICDGGGTFIQLAHKLTKDGVKNIHLYVSHGLFTKGTEVLRDAGIKRIFTHTGEIQGEVL